MHKKDQRNARVSSLHFVSIILNDLTLFFSKKRWYLQKLLDNNGRTQNFSSVINNLMGLPDIYKFSNQQYKSLLKIT